MGPMDDLFGKHADVAECGETADERHPSTAISQVSPIPGPVRQRPGPSSSTSPVKAAPAASQIEAGRRRGPIACGSGRTTVRAP